MCSSKHCNLNLKIIAFLYLPGMAFSNMQSVPSSIAYSIPAVYLQLIG